MPAASPTSSPGSGQPGKERGGKRARPNALARSPASPAGQQVRAAAAGDGSEAAGLQPAPPAGSRRRGRHRCRAPLRGRPTSLGAPAAAPPRPGARGAPSSSSAPPAMSPRERAAQPRGGRCPRPPPRLPDSPLLTRCLAAARPGQARAAATNAALFGARRLHVGRRAQARQPRAVLPAQRHLRLLPARGRNSGGLAALTQHHADAGLPAMLPAPRSRQPPGLLRMRCRRPAPAGSLPRPAAPGTRGAAAGGGTTDTRHTHTHTHDCSRSRLNHPPQSGPRPEAAGLPAPLPRQAPARKPGGRHRPLAGPGGSGRPVPARRPSAPAVTPPPPPRRARRGAGGGGPWPGRGAGARRGGARLRCLGRGSSRLGGERSGAGPRRAAGGVGWGGHTSGVGVLGGPRGAGRHRPRLPLGSFVRRCAGEAVGLWERMTPSYFRGVVASSERLK